MARDRKRAKQRQQRRPPRGAAAATDQKAAEAAGHSPSAPIPRSASGELQRGDLPGALEHASGEVDEFDAALVRGAGGVALDDTQKLEDADVGDGNGALAEAEVVEAETSERAVEHREHRRSLPARAVAFLRASWAELQRVQWPDRPQVSQATAVVLGFVAVAGVYLGAADWVAQKIINFIL